MADRSVYHCQEPRAKSQEPRAKSQEPRAKSQEPASALKILIPYHKPYTFPPLDDGIFLPIQVSKATSRIDLHIQGDNEVNGQPCDNISTKNEYYAELTAEYWAWKNLKTLYPDVKYIGLCHYRRFLALHENIAFCEAIPKPESFLEDFRYNPQEIIDILESGRIIVPKRLNFPYSAGAQYCISCVSDDYRALKEVLRVDFPDYYDAFIDVMERNNKMSFKLIHIMKWEDFDQWCRFVFAVMDILETKIPYQNYRGTIQSRVFAYLAERLFYVWQVKNRKQRKSCAIYMCDNNAVEHNNHVRFLHRLFNYARFEVSSCFALWPRRLSRNK